jgi:hypothetical protein
LLFHDLPDSVLSLHPQHDPVTPVIAHVHREQPFRQTIRFAEIELSQTAIGLYQLSELNVPDELYLHKAPFTKRLMNNSRATYQGGFLKNSEFFYAGIGRMNSGTGRMNYHKDNKNASSGIENIKFFD